DGGAHPSPNAGRCEAAFAGALGVSLGGTNVYQGRAERRGTLGDGPPPGPADLDRAIRLSRGITAAATALCAAAAYLLRARGSARGTRPPGPARGAPVARDCGRCDNAYILLWALWQRPQKKMPGAAAIGAAGAAGAAGAGVAPTRAAGAL